MSNLRLSIPEPCTENWNEMTLTEKGMYCGSCQKEVTDFSKMTKEEIKDFFLLKAPETTCGRFEKRQLAVFNLPDPEQKKTSYKPWWIAAATFFLFANQGYSQGKPYVEQNKMPVKVAPIATEAPKDDKTDPGDDLPTDSLVYVSGQILGFEGDTLYSATTRIKDANIGALTDFDGNFKLLVPAKFQDSLTLQISYIGFKTKTIECGDVKTSRNVGVIKFEEEMELMIFGGIHSVNNIEQPTRIVKAKRIFLRMFR